jgi:hypothetical protein
MKSFTGVGYDNFLSKGPRKVNVRLRVNMTMLGYVDDSLSSFFGTLLILRYPLRSYLSNPHRTHPQTDFQVF